MEEFKDLVLLEEKILEKVKNIQMTLDPRVVDINKFAVDMSYHKGAMDMIKHIWSERSDLINYLKKETE